MDKLSRLHGLYAITDQSLQIQRLEKFHETLTDMVSAAIQGGVRIIQYRNKTSSFEQKVSEAQALFKVCDQHNVTFLINDDIELAAQVNAHGVHLGQADTTARIARKKLGTDKIIGISCHSDIDLVRQAIDQGADYIALGRFFPSETKPEAPPATLTDLRNIRKITDVPIAVIGGLTPHNSQVLLEAGANMLAVINGIFGQTDIMAAAQAYAELFSEFVNEETS